MTENPRSAIDGGASAPEVASSRAARLINNVEVTLEAFVGDARLTVEALTALRTGDTVALEAALNQAVELRLNGAAVARGELVAVGDRFGVRLTDVAE